MGVDKDKKNKEKKYKNKEKKHKNKKTHKIRRILLLVLLVALLGVGGLFYMEYSRKTTDGEDIEVEIPEGSSTMDMVALLKEKGVIRFQAPMLVKLFHEGYYGKLKYGSYELNDGMSLTDILDVLASGQSKSVVSEDTIVLMLPEGYSAEKMAERIEEQGIMSGEEFLQAVEKAAADFVYADQLPAKEDVYYQLQGYLFPDTYYLDETTTADQLVAMMLDEFTKQYDDSCQQRAEELGMSMTEVLTRASMVEKETELPEEYATIAGVINNRLEQGMRIQFDSTVIYGMTDGIYGVDRVTYSDLEDDSPYNTYKIDGLPPGPIGNPGMDAIQAVLYPEEHNYLFFQTDMVKNDGSNLYFETYEEHMAAYSTATTGEEETTAAESSTGAAATTTQSSSEATSATTEKSTEATSATTEKSIEATSAKRKSTTESSKSTTKTQKTTEKSGKTK